MKMTKIDISNPQYQMRNKSNCQLILTEFLNMNTPAVRIDDVTGYYKTLKGGCNSLYKAACRNHLPIEVSWYDNAILLIRTDMGSNRIDISEFEFEERVNNELFDEATLYFIAPKKLLGGKYPEAEHATIRIDFATYDPADYTVTISPTRNGEDYDWQDYDMDDEIVEKLQEIGMREGNK